MPNYYVNNHIHTTYSFSPYTPAQAAKAAKAAGLATAGIMDHDSVSGAQEFVAAGREIGIATTVGMECRVKTDGTPLYGRRINNPDQKSIAYVAMHGIPIKNIAAAEQFIAPYRAHRNIRNRAMTENLSKISGFALDFDRDIAAISMSHKLGSITERHILYALSTAITQKFGKNANVIDYLKSQFNLSVSGKQEGFLLDPSNPYYQYDLLGVLKSALVEQFYINADAECPHISEFIAFANSIGAISAYAYLGDVTDSVTGDKKAQTFEDSYLDILFDTITGLGFCAVTYMPSRNTATQLEAIRQKCEANSLFQISGEDINSPRQSFVCQAMSAPEFSNLITSTWALIGHEKAAANHLDDGMFGKNTIAKYPNLEERIEVFARIGRE